MKSRFHLFLLVFVCISPCFAWSTTAFSKVKYFQTNEIHHIANKHIGISISKLNGDITSFVNKNLEFDILAANDVQSSLYRVTYRNNSEELVRFSNKDAEKVEFSLSQNKNSIQFDMSFLNHKDLNINVIISLELSEASSLVYFHAKIENRTKFSVNAIRLPSFYLPRKIGDSASNDFLVLPKSDGMIINDLSQSGLRPTVNLPYPGSASMQFMAFFDQNLGLYLASYDSKGYPKGFGYELGQNGVTFFIENRFPMEIGKNLSTKYQNVIGFIEPHDFDEDINWYDAADIYKKWAVEQPWCVSKVADRNDIPPWFKKVPVIIDYPINRGEEEKDNFDIPKLIQEYSDFLDMPILARPTGWEKHGTWIGPDIFPPFRHEKFRSSIDQIHKDGNRLFLYLEGYQWMLKDSKQSYVDKQYFLKNCGDCATIKQNGDYKFRRNNKVFAEGCRTTKTAQRVLQNNVMNCTAIGADAVQIEVVGGGGKPCYSKKHNHPPGYGRWIFERFSELLETARSKGRLTNPDLVITIEEPCELYIPFIDGYNGRDFREFRWPRDLPGSMGIPLFTYIYHEYALGFSGYHWNFLNEGKRLYQYRDIATNFVFGKFNGFRIHNDTRQRGIARHNPKAKSFLRETALAISSLASPYLLFGKMLRPAKLTCDQVSFNYPDSRGVKKKNTRKKPIRLTQPQVLHSVWSSPAGNIGYVFANYTDKVADFEVSIEPFKTTGIKTNLNYYMDGALKETYNKMDLPKKIRFKLEPLKIMLVELKPD